MNKIRRDAAGNSFFLPHITSEDLVDYYKDFAETYEQVMLGPFCLLLGVSAGCAQPIKGLVTSATWHVIGWA